MSDSDSTRQLNGFIVLGYAVTPLHPGVGRAPGAVDLPVQRDPMGYPIVFASSVKGALKAECGRRAGRGVNCFDSNGRIKCSDADCSLCCCLFGSEPKGDKASAGLLSVLDFIPIAFPVPSLDKGYVYVTTPYLARRALSVFEAVTLPGNSDELSGFLRKVAELDLGAENRVYGCVESSRVAIGLEKINVKNIDGGCRGLDALQGLGGLASDVSSRLVVVGDDKGPLYVEKGLIRVARVRLNIATKTVSEGALWTEEYIPAGTLFLGGFIATLPKKNEYCAKALEVESKQGGQEEKTGSSDVLITEEMLANLINMFESVMELADNKVYMIIGGKETIGRGLVKLEIRMTEPKVKKE